MAITAAVSLGEAKDFLRVAQDGEDALISGLLVSATEACEGFTGRALIARTIEEVLPIRAGEWQRLAMAPVRAITSVEGLPAEGSAFALPITDYAIDIDGGGDGRVRVIRQGIAGRVRVTYGAGIAEDAEEVPQCLRQGIVRMAAHLFAHRDAADDHGPPPIVLALWRMWRRPRLA